MQVPQGRFDLVRHPPTNNPTLRAWDAADEFVLSHLATEVGVVPDGAWLVANDTFGALACALVDHRPASWSDSSLAHEALRRNLARNGLDADAVDVLESTQEPAGPVAVAVLKVPRALALLEDQLRRLRPHLVPGAVVIGAGMTRRVHNSTIDAFETIVGPTSTSLARRKARLLFAEFATELEVGPAPGPGRIELEDGTVLIGLANVFAKDRLDPGARVLLEHLPALTEPMDVVDVGCGNGVLGTVAAAGNAGTRVTFTDESYQAVESSRLTFAANHPGRSATHLVADGLTGVPDASMDVVLCNPPFHAQNAVGDRDAWEMFTGARRVLRPGGQLWVVGNRHLGYHAKLRRVFDDVEVVGSDPRFVALRATA